MGARGREANPNLTDTEERVLYFIADGYTQERIGHQLGGVTKRAVEHHCNMIRAKLGAVNLPHAVAIGFKRGILLLPKD
jgi:DNA-binding CsgD family transcriptional regulator